MLGFVVTFKSPMLLFFVLLLPVALALYVWLDRRRARRALSWSSAALLPNMLVGSPGRKRHIPVALFGLALLLLLLGFARPEARFKEAADGATIVVMIDTSGSMGADDVKPTRLLAADQAVTGFVKRLPSRYRAALLTFSNSIAVAAPPTYDRQLLINALPKKAQLEVDGNRQCARRGALRRQEGGRDGRERLAASARRDLGLFRRRSEQRFDLADAGGESGAQGGDPDLDRLDRHSGRRRPPADPARERNEDLPARRAGAGRAGRARAGGKAERRTLLLDRIAKRTRPGLRRPRRPARLSRAAPRDHGRGYGSFPSSSSSRLRGSRRTGSGGQC